MPFNHHKISTRNICHYMIIMMIFLMASTAFAETWQERAARRKREAQETKEMVSSPTAAPKLVTLLQSKTDADEREEVLQRFGKAFNDAKAFDTLEATLDELMKQGDLNSSLLAADLLMKTVENIKTSSYGATRESRDFPDSVCDRGVKLLSHPDPVVQAVAEWALANRVKKVNAGTRKVNELMLPGKVKAAWYKTWRSRPASMDLQDDYARQLASLNRHLDLKGLQTDISKITARMEKVLAAPGSAKVDQSAYQDALKAVREAKDLIEGHNAYINLRMEARKLIEAARKDFPSEGIAFYTDPRITGGVWNVNVVVTGNTNIPAGDIYVKKSTNPADPAKGLDITSKLEAGSCRGIDLHWDGDRMVFSWWHQPLDPDVKPFGWELKTANLYEIDLDGNNLKPVTKDPANSDVEPCYLPNGGFFFASDRSKFGNQCAGPFLQNKICTTIYRIDPEGKQPIAISNNKDFDRHPHVMNDGTVTFMRWEYQERDLYTLHNAWNCRPDGTSMDAFFKQHISTPASIRDVRQVEGSNSALLPYRVTTTPTTAPLFFLTHRLELTTPMPCGTSLPAPAPSSAASAPRKTDRPRRRRRKQWRLLHQPLPHVRESLPCRPRHAWRRIGICTLLHRRLGQPRVAPPRPRHELFHALSPS